MSNYPLSYKLSWLPRFLNPSLRGDKSRLAPASGVLMDPAPSQKVQLAFIGDISAVANSRPPECDPAIVQLLKSADMVVGNCESPILDRPSAVLGTRLGTHHAVSERFLVDTLSAAGIPHDKLVLSLANNHILDQGVAGFDETYSTLARLGIRMIGTVIGGPIHHHIAGPLTIGFGAFTLWRNAGAAKFQGRVSMLGDPAAWPREAVSGADFLCAMPHWDWEFRHFPRPGTRALAQRLADHGVRLVAGHHAHVVQPVERMGEGLVAYGLGDFLGTAFVRQPWPSRIGSILVVDVSGDADTRGRIAAYRLHFFMRLTRDGHERLIPVEGLDGTMKERVGARLEAIFPPSIVMGEDSIRSKAAIMEPAV